MLKALYDYGMRRQLALPPGFVEKTIKAYISLSEHDDHVSVYLGDEEAVPCPDIGSLANGKDKSNVLREKRSVVIPQEPGSKSAFFLETLRCAAAEEPLLNVCVHALENRKRRRPSGRSWTGPRSSRETGSPSGSTERRVLRSEKVRAWWQDYRKQFFEERGAPHRAVSHHRRAHGPHDHHHNPFRDCRVVGGHARGDALICFDKAAFCSYGQKKAANAPVSEEAFSVVKAALDDLLKDAPILAGMKFVHWFDREIPPEDDPLHSIDLGFDPLEAPETEEEAASPINEGTARNRADQVLNSIDLGQPVPDLDDVSLLHPAALGRQQPDHDPQI